MNARQRDAIAWAQRLRQTLGAEPMEEGWVVYPCVRCFERAKVGYATHSMRRVGGTLYLLHGGCEHGPRRLPWGPLTAAELGAAVAEWNAGMRAVAKAHTKGFTLGAKRLLMERTGWPMKETR